MATQKASKQPLPFNGRWHITEMSQWDEDYFNMEVQAYLEINPGGLGEFQFGLVWGQLDGRETKIERETIYSFSWEGNDECDPASGSGWCKLKDGNTLEGEIQIHRGDSSTFIAERAE
ncbi:MAG: hypothetical protein SVX43_07925 [Cyanobacteriota bacterium]|nr:hypothetical protein [Cyanobacteriota bacterium]